MKKRITFTGGDKGGVGKSTAASAYGDHLLAKGITTCVVETDTCNPDVARMFQGAAPVLLADVADHDGWMSLLEALETREEQHVVVSLPAGSARVESELELITAALTEMGYEARLLFCINRQVDSVALARASLTRGLASICASGMLVKNGFYGNPEQFERWDQSDIRAQWWNRGFTEGYLPELHHRVVDWVTRAEVPYHQALPTMPQILRLELSKWLKACAVLFADLERSVPPSSSVYPEVEMLEEEGV